MSSAARKLSIVIPLVLIALPAILFCSILARYVIDVPMFDDYDAVLGFLNHLKAAPTFWAKLIFFLGSQHSEYKLFFEEAVFWAQVKALGHINLPSLCMLGNGFALLLGIVLWRMFLPAAELSRRLIFFIPVSWLLFQLQYAQTLDFPIGALQNLPVIVFSLAAIHLLFETKRWSFSAALALFVLAISSSGNGLVLIPIGLVVLAVRRDFRRIFAWAGVSAVCMASYLYNYTPANWQTPSGSVIPAVARLRSLGFAVSLLGSAGAYPIRAGGIVLGTLLCLFCIYVGRRGYFRKRPDVGYSVVFLVLTSICLTCFRLNYGFQASMASRYTIYSTLLLIFGWFAIVELWLDRNRHLPWRNPMFVCAACGAICFSVAMDVWGARFLERRNRDLIIGMSLYARNPSPQATSGPVFPPPATADVQAFNLRVREILRQSSELGIYRPPAYRDVR
ncbi:MAG: hypothetical protein JO061_14590 [Acidobacteriaceae bacterium]|nr:hypothetical protein [Acidobacteriaceae bacterium]